MYVIQKKKYGNLALVAGASEGIGAAFAGYLAKEEMDLVLVARRRKPLEKLASSLTEKHNINIDCITTDLSVPCAVQNIIDKLGGREINILVYNAALSYIGPFEENSIEHHKKIVRTNAVTPLDMIQCFAESMLRNRKGAIILMSSLAGFQGSGFLAAYAASKAFNRVLAESLWYEWKDRGVDVIACCAGATATENYLRTNPGKSGFLAPAVQSPDEVVRECFKYLGKKPSIVTGRGNRVATFFMHRILPGKMAVKIMGNNTHRIYSHKIIKK